MTTTPAPAPAVPRFCAEVLDTLADRLRPDPANGDEVTAGAAPYVPAEAAALDRAVEHLEQYAGVALAAPIRAAASAASAELCHEAASGEYWRGVANDLRQHEGDDHRLLADAHLALTVVGQMVGATIDHLARAQAEADALAEYADQCAATDRMPSPARTGAVRREARKAVDRNLDEHRRLIEERIRPVITVTDLNPAAGIVGNGPDGDLLTVTTAEGTRTFRVLEEVPGE